MNTISLISVVTTTNRMTMIMTCTAKFTDLQKLKVAPIVIAGLRKQGQDNSREDLSRAQISWRRA